MEHSTTRHSLQKAKRTVWRFTALLLILCFVMPYIAPALPASAANEGISKSSGGVSVASQEGKACENTYLLRVSTGVNGGADVSYFAVHYKDKGGVSRVEFVSPNSHPKESTYELAMSVSGLEKRLSNVENYTGYTVDIDNLMSSNMLMPNSTDEILFTPHYTVDSITSVDVHEHYSSTYKKGWTCKGISIYKVETLYGLQMIGYYSTSLFIDFSGKAIYSFNKTVDLNLSGNDKVFCFAPSGGDYQFVSGNNEAYSTHDSDEYLFEIDIADFYKAGIEKMMIECPFRDMILIKEVLMLDITYEDVGGVSYSAKLPVLSSAAAWSTENGYAEYDKALCPWKVLQQGEQLVFSGKLPAFKKMTSCKLSYTLDVPELAGIKNTVSGRLSPDLENWTKDKLEKDTLSISSFKLYKNVDQLEYTGDGETDLFYTINGIPIAYVMAEGNSGITLSYDSPKTLSVKENDTGADLSPDYKGRYVVVIKTDTPKDAGTTSEVKIKFTYQSTSGVTKTTKTYSLITAPEDFYGYWPYYDNVFYDDGSAFPDYHRYYGLRPGGEIMFFMDVDDVSQFKSFDISMNSTYADDWQMKSLIIYDPEWIGHRVLELHERGEGAGTGKVTSNWIITRDFDKSTIMCSYGASDKEKPGEEPIYVNGGDEETANRKGEFEESSENKESDVETDLDWNKLKHSMTYKESMQDLGFNRVRGTYEVEVQVAGNDSANEKDGDTGSKNLFYFQLTFQGGNSGYVLANQQLTADGFRAGEKESFTIYTNQDLGDLTAIRILPDDSDTNESTDIFDKLNIKSITVTKKSSAVASTSWFFDNVGWIKIDYRDDAPKNTASGLQGRNASDLVREFTVSGKGVSSNLMVSITTDPYNVAAEDTYSGEAFDSQFEGTVTATVTYINKDGEQKKNFDVVQKMYEYNGQQPRYETREGKSLGKMTGESGGEVVCAVSNREYMFREGHTDRFFISLTDVTSIKKIELFARDVYGTTWNIKEVKVWQLLENGTLRLNCVDEFQRHTDNQMKLITKSDQNTYAVILPPNQDEGNQVITFEDNTIVTKESEEGWSSTITRKPENRNDSLNVYVYMAENAQSPVKVSNGQTTKVYDLRAELTYESSDHDGPMRMTVNGLNYDTTDRVFYATGITAYGFTTLNKTNLVVPSLDKVSALVDHMIVQHVRSGVVIGYYYMDYHTPGTGNPINVFSSTGEQFPSSKHSISTEQQIVTMLFGKDTVASGLVAEASDVAISIRYTLKGDPLGKEYSSPYVFLTDVKTKDADGQEIMKYAAVKPGLLVQVPFAIPNLKEITGITVAGTGSVNASVDGMTVGCYPIQGDTSTPTKWYNFAAAAKLTATPVLMSVTDVNVAPVEITVTTAESTDVVSSSTADPIRMTIGYVSQDGRQTRTMAIDDVRAYMTDGKLEAGKTATFSFLMKNCSEIRYVVIEPHSKEPYSQAAWGIENLKVRTIVDGKEQLAERKLSDPIIREGDPRTINLCNISISTKTSFYNSKVEKSSTINSDSQGKSAVLVYSGDQVTIKPTVNGSLAGYGYTVSAVKAVGDAVSEVDCFTKNGSQIVFDSPRNTTGGIEVYRVIITSDENPAVQAVVEISVEAENTMLTTTEPTTASTEPTPTEETSPETTETVASGSETEVTEPTTTSVTE